MMAPTLEEGLDLPDEVVKEERALEKEINMEEEEKQKKLEMLAMKEGSAEHEVRYKRLMCLLDRSKFYANFLLQRMASKKEEEKLKAEKQAKKEAAAEKKKQTKQEKENSTVENGKTETKTVGQKTRGAKRQNELRSPSGDASDSKQKTKRTRKANLSEADILNIIDEEELHKRAAQSTDDDEEEDSHDVHEEAKESKESGEEQLPELFEGGTMRPYQMEGFRWLVSLYENGMNGILADEMGLGKTVQCISLIAHLMDKGVTGPFLVCAPLSTLPNWMSELKRFTPRIPTVLYHGPQEKRDELLLEIKQKFKIPGIPALKYFPVVVTSFDVVIRDRKVLERFQWRYIIVDEGHRLKNFQSRLVQELKKYPSSNRLLLTGTPLQNNLSELWSLLNFLLPEIFDDLDVFTSWFRVEEFQSSDADHKIVEMEKKENVLSMLHQILSPFLLRRLKSDVDIQLPKKKELLVYCPMSKLQADLYRATVDKTIATLLGPSAKEEEAEVQTNGRPKRRAKRNVNYSAMGTDDVTEELKKKSMKKEDEEIDEWIKLSNDLHRDLPQAKKRGTKTVDVKMQNPMMQLRKIVNHPSLVKWEIDAETGDYVVDESMVSDCGKLSVLDQMLKRLIKEGHKVLVFSQLTIMLDVLADYLTMRGWKFGRLDGRMSLDDRAEDMERFRNDPDTPVFLISTRAGGLGVNLTAADTVIIYDSDWNPQCDLQAQDRCHRLGQTRPVVVYRFVTADTIDQRIIDRAGAKRKLEKLVIQKGKFKSGLQTESSTGLSVNELLDLLKTRDHSGEYRGGAGLVFTEEELNTLLDRSDLEEGSQKKAPEELNHMKGVFKRLDSNAADDVKSK